MLTPCFEWRIVSYSNMRNRDGAFINLTDGCSETRAPHLCSIDQELKLHDQSSRSEFPDSNVNGLERTTTGFEVLLDGLESGAIALVGADPVLIKYLRQSFDELKMYRKQNINRLERKFDPEGWQWEQNGKCYQLEELSRDDLIQVACEEMVVMERVDGMAFDLSRLVEKWRRGDISNKTDEE